jgi:hypothetical protein
MGQLAEYLKTSFIRYCPVGWSCYGEKRVLSEDIEEILGYKPQADLCLEDQVNNKRVWIEFEISRADPVANHAKFATAHLFQPFSDSDTFVSMVSSHVTRGRRNLASNTIHLLRRVGICAYQTVLLPSRAPDEIKRLNHASSVQLSQEGLDVKSELSRVFEIIEPVIVGATHRIHFAAELLDVIRNLHRWNSEVANSCTAALWGRRTVRYFVFDPVSKLFAPSKFCAYVIPQSSIATDESSVGLMDMTAYCSLDEGDSRFDGHRAQKHLTKNLGMRITTGEMDPPIAADFATWLARHSLQVTVHPAGAVFVKLPEWYR